jgi:hypothetical protein
MVDGDVGRRDQHRLGVGEHVVSIPAIIVAYTDGRDTAKGHRLDEQVDVGLVDRAATERKLTDEAIDRRLVPAVRLCSSRLDER